MTRAVAAPAILRRARPEEADALTALALASKAHWGYDAAFLARCRPALTLRPDAMPGLRAHVAELSGRLAGFFTVTGAPPEGALEHLYVAPAAIGQGVGRALLRRALELAREEGFRSLAIHADPHAEAFYLGQGAVRRGEVPSEAIPGRLLPLLSIDCDPPREA